MKLGFWLGVLCICLMPGASAEDIHLHLGDGTTTAKILQIFVAVTVLALAPSLLMMMTSFTRIIIVLSFLRNAIGLQQAPPNMVLVSLAMFLTFFVMAPVFQKAYDQGMEPLMAGKISEPQAWEKVGEPFHKFMLAQVREQDLQLFAELGHVQAITSPQETPWRILLPAFLISELRRAFEIGFLLFIPFLVIDLVVSSVLMAMGMMMLPPTVVSLPIKLVFFVLVDGWSLLSNSLVKGFHGLG